MAFLTLSNFLPIPWFNVVGNHDVMFFGSFTQDDLEVEGPRDVGTELSFSRREFVKVHGDAGLDLERANDHLAKHIPTERFKPAGTDSSLKTRSFYHGFDRASHDACVGCQQPTSDGSRGAVGTPVPEATHYSVLISLEPLIRLLVIDTSRADEAVSRLGRGELPVGAFGYLRESEFEWLRDELQSAELRREAVILAGHHPLTVGAPYPIRGTVFGQRNASVLDALKQFPALKAYFSGHTHYAALRAHERSGSDLVEVVAPSLHVHPQIALLATILRSGSELALSIRPIRGEITAGPLQYELNEACQGAAEEQGHARPCWQEDDQVCGFFPL